MHLMNEVQWVNILATESSKAFMRFADASELCQKASSDSIYDDKHLNRPRYWHNTTFCEIIDKYMHINFVLFYEKIIFTEWTDKTTRKLCYCKDDRAMRPIYRCPENFAQSLTTPTPLVSEIFNGLLLGLSLRMFRPNLKFIAFSVPELIGGTQKIGQSLDTPTPLCL